MYSKFLFFAFIILLQIENINAQTIIDDNFESYAIQSYLCANSPHWRTWSGPTGGLEDVRITNKTPNETNKSITIEGNNSFPQGGPTDVLLKLGNKTSGVYSVSFDFFLGDFDGAYYSFQHFEQPGVEWAFGVYMDGGVGANTAMIQVEVQGQRQFTNNMMRNQWVNMEHIFNLDADKVTLYVDGFLIGTWPISWQEASSAVGTKQLGALNFFPYDFSHKYHIDNVKFVETMAVGTNIPEKTPVQVYPNPTSDFILFDFGGRTSDLNTAFDITLYDMTGKTVLTQNSAQPGDPISVQNLNSGVYFYKVTTQEGVYTGQISKE